jgi:hypothetical protein
MRDGQPCRAVVGPSLATSPIPPFVGWPLRRRSGLVSPKSAVDLSAGLHLAYQLAATSYEQTSHLGNNALSAGLQTLRTVGPDRYLCGMIA